MMAFTPLLILSSILTVVGLIFARKERAERLRAEANRATSGSRKQSKHAARA